MDEKEISLTDNENLKENHLIGFHGLKRIYPLKKFLKSPVFILSLSIAIFFILYIILTKQNTIDLLKDLINLNLSIFPNLLGFNLGGYILIIGFGNTSLIKSMTRPLNDTKWSLFQTISSIFAFSFLMQAVVLILSFVISFIIKLNISLLNNLDIYVNFGCFFLLILLTLVSILNLPQLIINIFTFGQDFHFYLSMERIKESKELENQNHEKSENDS